jgi:hypothetical protein
MDEYAHGQVRAATHYDVAASDIGTVLGAVREALEETAPTGSAATRDDAVKELQGV